MYVVWSAQDPTKVHNVYQVPYNKAEGQAA